MEGNGPWEVQGTKSESVLLYLNCLPGVLCLKCSVTLLYGAMGWSAYSLAFSVQKGYLLDS